MKLNKIIISSICVLMLFVTGCGSSKLKNGEEMVVKLDGSKITADDLYKDLKSKYGKYILIDMIDRIILDKKYPTNQDITDQVNNQIASMKEQYGDNFTAYIQQNGFEKEEELVTYLELAVKRNMAVKAYVEKSVTDKEIKDYYDNEVVGDIRVSHILIKPDVTDSMTDAQKTAKETEALNQAKDIIKKLKNGEKFADLAKKYSDDTASASNGGDVGWFNKGQMDSAFEKAAYALEKGKYTGTPVKSQYGYHIILKVDTKAKAALDTIRTTVISDIAEDKLTNDSTLSNKMLEQLRKDNKLVFYDSDLKTEYDDYMKTLDTK